MELLPLTEERGLGTAFSADIKQTKAVSSPGPHRKLPQAEGRAAGLLWVGEEPGQAPPPLSGPPPRRPSSPSRWSHLQLHPHAIHGHHLVLEDRRAEGEVGAQGGGGGLASASCRVLHDSRRPAAAPPGCQGVCRARRCPRQGGGTLSPGSPPLWTPAVLLTPHQGEGAPEPAGPGPPGLSGARPSPGGGGVPATFLLLSASPRAQAQHCEVALRGEVPTSISETSAGGSAGLSLPWSPSGSPAR